MLQSGPLPGLCIKEAASTSLFPINVQIICLSPIPHFARIWRFELEIQSTLLADNSGNQFTEQVRSERAPIEMDPSGVGPSSVILQKGTRKNASMQVWEYNMTNGERVRPQIETGWVEPYLLMITPVMPTETASGNGDCPQSSSAPRIPTDAKILCFFGIHDPVHTMEVEDAKHVWQPVPVGGNCWETLMALTHAPDGEYAVDYQLQDVGPYTGFIIAGKKWEYLGGEPFAEATFNQTKSAGVTVEEKTVLDLYFAPKPLQDSDTRLPPPSP